MPRKVKEDEIDVNIIDKPKKETFVTQWFRQHCVNDVDTIKIVNELAARDINEQFGIQLRNNNYELMAVIFYATYMSILEFLKSKQKQYSRYTIEIANSLNIGYTNDTDDDNEKVGNFMPVLEYIGVNRNLNNIQTDDNSETSMKCIMWKQLNAKKSVEHIKEIQENAFQKLISDYNTHLKVSEAVIPCFCIYFDNLIGVLRTKLREAHGTDMTESSIHVFSLFRLYCSYDEDNSVEIIDIEPGVISKMFLKSDTLAASM